MQCRLKDISNLFLDTGIGSDSYSIIALSMVDDILKDKDNSRKRLFEEAAGISKYKLRKKQTLQKLEHTDNDLDRVEDLLYEIEGNLKTLESQANKTKRYYQLKENYKEQSTELAKFTIDAYRKKFDELEKENQEHKDISQNIETNIKSKEAEIEKKKLESLTKEKELAESQKIVNTQLEAIRDYENNKKIKNERQKFLTDKKINLKANIQQDEESIANLKEEIKGLDNQKENERSLLAEIEFNANEIKSSLEQTKKVQQSSKEKLDELNDQYIRIQQDVHGVEIDIDRNKTKIESINQEFARNNQENETFTTNIKELEEKLSETNTEKSRKQEGFNKISKQDEELQKKIEIIEAEISSKSTELVDTNRKLDATQNEFNLTKSLVENLEGFPESIKFLKMEADWGKNVPLFSDILFCKPEYRVAIESYLEPYMNYFIANTIEEARVAVSLLSEAAKGKANFFILSELKKQNTIENNLGKDYVNALNVIEIEEKYELLIKKLLGNVLIIENEVKLSEFTSNLSNGLSKKIDPNKITFLDKQGRFIKKAHTLSGGSVGLFEGKRIGRAKNLKVLSKNITNYTSKSNKLKEEITTLEGQLETLSKSFTHEQFNKLREELSSLQNKLVELNTKIDHYKNQIQNNKNRNLELKNTLSECELKINDLNPQLITHQENQSKLKESFEKYKSEYDTITTTADEQSLQYNQENIKVHQQRNKLSVIDRDISYKDSQIENTTIRIGNNTIDLNKTKEQILEITSNAEENDSELTNMYNKKEELEKALEKTEELHYKARGDIEEVEKLLRELRNKKENALVINSEIKERISEVKIKINSLKERLSVEFNINIENIINQEPNKDYNEEELRAKVEKMRNRLENYGTINPMAIEAYDEIQKRHDFIVEQREDLFKAKESLLQTIQEIDDTAKVQFLEAFHQVRENFIEVFRSLFSEEDNCDLILEDPDDPLETDIDIIAKPKGKRPLNINQLSSGESTLTAI
ncbi:MAG: chromosome segregation protein SMC, partial [Bacteroidia bacterium]|nr:chromosome segregation protein SMC [Bacteroidia bacterium]